MNTKVLIIVGVVAAVAVGGALLSREKTTAPALTDDSSGLTVGKNAIYVSEHVPGRHVSVSVVALEKRGFVAVHEDSAGKPGKILGVSVLLPAGETKNAPPITLSRTTSDGETIYAMLHLDNGDGVFDATKDKPALDSVGGGPTMMVVTISKDAAEAGEVSL